MLHSKLMIKELNLNINTLNYNPMNVSIVIPVAIMLEDSLRNTTVLGK